MKKKLIFKLIFIFILGMTIMAETTMAVLNAPGADKVKTLFKKITP
ncbi:MAG: hypothetical protein PVH61_15295 [Candidatus Aminicenantes bacterium]|jgi:hypothetical protein